MWEIFLRAVVVDGHVSEILPNFAQHGKFRQQPDHSHKP